MKARPFRPLDPLRIARDLLATRGASGHFAILHTGRVGSTVVGKMLVQNAKLRYGGELFERRNPRPGRDVGHDWRDRLSPLVDLRSRVGHAHRTDHIFGFETKPLWEEHGCLYKLGLKDYLDRLDRMGFSHIIELRRKNYLRQLLSMVRLLDSGTSHVKVGGEISVERVMIDVHSVPLGPTAKVPMLERFRRIDELHHEIAQAFESRHGLSLDYETYVEKDPTVAYQKICEFIGLAGVPADIKLRRTNPGSLRDLIANFDEVADHLAGTEYEWMLESQPV